MGILYIHQIGKDKSMTAPHFQEWRKIGTLAYCLRKCFVQPYQRANWQYVLKLKVASHYIPAFPLLSLYTRKTLTYAQGIINKNEMNELEYG